MKDAAGLTTARLTLRRFAPDDFEWFHGLNGDPVVKRLMGGPATREGSETMMRERILDYYAQNPGLGIWMTLERASNRPVGFHLLNHIKGATDIQVGYTLDPAHWGKGYATEMSIALLRYGFVDLGLTQIVAITDLENVPSQRVLLKAGLHRHGERSYAAYAGGAPMAFFQREREPWLAEFGHGAP